MEIPLDTTAISQPANKDESAYGGAQGGLSMGSEAEGSGGTGLLPGAPNADANGEYVGPLAAQSLVATVKVVVQLWRDFGLTTAQAMTTIANTVDRLEGKLD